MKKGVSPIISMVLLLVIVIAALSLFRVWYFSETQHGQLTISNVVKEKGTQSLEDIVVENCDGSRIWIKNQGVNDIYFMRNGLFTINLYRNNTELNLNQVVLSPVSPTPGTYVLHPGQIVQMDLSAVGNLPLGQSLKLTTENRRSLFFSYNVGSVIVSADPTDIWANDGNDSTTADLSVVTAYVTDSFGNPITSVANYPILSFYVDNGTITPTGTLNNGKATANYRSNPYTTAEIKNVEGVWYHYDHAVATAGVSETADGTASGTVVRTVRGSVMIDFKAIVNAYGELPTACSATLDTNDGGNHNYLYQGDVATSDYKLRYIDGEYITQTSYDTSDQRTSGDAFSTNPSGNPTDGQYTEIRFCNTLPTGVDDTNYTLTSVKVSLYHYETGVELSYAPKFRDDLWVNDNCTPGPGCTGTWRYVQDYSLIGSTFGPFLSVNLINVGGVSIVNTIAKAKNFYIRLLYNPCLTQSAGSTTCVDTGSEIHKPPASPPSIEQDRYAMYADYAAVIIEYTKKNP